MDTPNEIEKQRLDLFAAAALTGLLASGKFGTAEYPDQKRRLNQTAQTIAMDMDALLTPIKLQTTV